jgi:hypothetical protein
LGFEDLSGGGSEFEGPFGGQGILSGDGPNAIGAKVFTVGHLKYLGGEMLKLRSGGRGWNVRGEKWKVESEKCRSNHFNMKTYVSSQV